MKFVKKKCKKCGKCCQGFAFKIGDLSQDMKNYYTYHERVSIKEMNGEQYLFFDLKCKHLNEKNRCDIYANRPQCCREGYSQKKEGYFMPEGCGFQ